MKVSDLKKLIEVPAFNAVKSNNLIIYYEFLNFVAISEDNYKIQSYNGTSIAEVSDISGTYKSFIGCILSSDLTKFLGTLSDDDEILFEQDTNNNIIIRYGKKNKFILKSIKNSEFPAIDLDNLCNSEFKTIQITDKLMSNLTTAIKYCSKTFPHLNGIFFNRGAMYSTDRSAIYKSINIVDDTINCFIPIECIKFMIKFKDYFTEIKIYEKGFLLSGGALKYWHPSSDVTMPNFSNIFNDKELIPIFISIDSEVQSIFDRVDKFSEYILFDITKDNLQLSCDNISEFINIENSSEDAINFKLNSRYIKDASQICNSIKLYKNKEEDIKLIKCDNTNDSFEIIIAVIV